MSDAVTVLFHLPYALTPKPQIAPQIRPRRMIAAFKEIGCNVVVISGAPADRRRQMKSIKKQVRSGGLKIDLVYSESAGWPNAFSDGGRSFHPLLDANFLRFMNGQGIRVHLFYRDAYHRSQEFFEVPLLQRLRRHVLRYFAEHDLRTYNTYVDQLYLPSLEMRAVVPEYRGPVRALPPGGDTQVITPHDRSDESPLRLLYVGGLGDLYRLHELVSAVNDEPNVHLTICTREGDWRTVRHEYQDLAGTEVVHRSGDSLLPLYRDADIAILSVAPNPYRDFAVPVKLFEYISHGKPVMASANTLAGDYIADHALGWVVQYERGAIKDLLSLLSTPDRRSEIRRASTRVSVHAKTIGWDARARQVLNDAAEHHSVDESVRARHRASRR